MREKTKRRESSYETQAALENLLLVQLQVLIQAVILCLSSRKQSQKRRSQFVTSSSHTIKKISSCFSFGLSKKIYCERMKNDCWLLLRPDYGPFCFIDIQVASYQRELDQGFCFQDTRTPACFYFLQYSIHIVLPDCDVAQQIWWQVLLQIDSFHGEILQRVV